MISVSFSGQDLGTQITVSSEFDLMLLCLCYCSEKLVDFLFVLFYLDGENEKSCGWSIEKKIELLESSLGKVNFLAFPLFCMIF